jgi:hypothetical protein
MKESNFLDGDGLKNLRGRVTPQIVELPGGEFEIHWTCPFCKDNLYMNAVEYLVNYTIEDGRTGFAHCEGADYAIVLPKLLPEGFWTKVPHRMN